MNATKSQSLQTSPYFKRIFKPSRWRYLSFRVLVMFTAYQAAITLFQGFYGSRLGPSYPPEVWLFYSLIFTAVYSVSLYFSTRSVIDDLCIKISDSAIEGPAGNHRKRIHFPLEKVDRSRTMKTGWQNRLFQYRDIWSIDGKKIVLYTHTFDPAQVTAVLEKLGCC